MLKLTSVLTLCFAALGCETTDSSSGDPPKQQGSSADAASSDGTFIDCQSAKSGCPTAPPLSQGEITNCKNELGGKCARQYDAYAKCHYAKEVCRSDGKVDHDASDVACQAEIDAYHACANN